MKRRIVGVLMLAGVAAAAQAEEIKAVKKSGGQQVMDTLYGKVEGRVQTYQFVDKDGDTQRSRVLVMRPTLGTKLLNEKFDVNFSLPVTNKQQSAVSKQERPEVETNLSLFDNKVATIDLYSFHYMQNKDKAYDGYVMVDLGATKSFDVSGLGKIETGFTASPGANLTTKSKDATVNRRERIDGTALAENDPAAKETIEQRETNKTLDLYPSVALSPSAVPGLKLTVSSYFSTNYTPEYIQVVDDSGESKVKSDGYAIERSTQARYTVKYQINEGVFVYNQLRQNIGGFADAGLKSGNRLDNRTGIVMNLF